ncbi:MAG TPA: gluconolaconase, partial [Mycobacterium sp.]|nr:gluconolaconase [Mycobacterium sp.]
MPIWLPRNAVIVGLIGLSALAGCSSESTPQRSSSPGSSTAPAAPAPGSPQLVSAPLTVPGDMAQAPLDQPRQALIPQGWTIGVWARIPKARLETWTPDGALLVSLPGSGQIVKLTPKSGAAPEQSTMLDGLDQPHGMAFAGNTLYVAESDQIDAYDYVNGAAVNPRTVAADLPDAKSPDLNGAYAHALKSVAVGPDGAVYFSIGS